MRGRAREREADRFQYAPVIPHHFGIRESHHAKTLFFQIAGSGGLIAELDAMCIPINLDHQLMPPCYEIDD